MSEPEGTRENTPEQEQLSEADGKVSPDTLISDTSRERAFTVKSILFGLLGVLVISTASSFNDVRLKQGLMVGNHFPIGAFFFFFFLTFLWNYCFSKAGRKAVEHSRGIAAQKGLQIKKSFANKILDYCNKAK